LGFNLQLPTRSEVKTKFSTRCRNYGYFIWPVALDGEMEKIVSRSQQTVVVTLGETVLGEKPIDWKYRRLSLGYAHTRNLPSWVKEFVAIRKRDGGLQIKCE
jgi:hypothetical protein